MDKLVNRSIFRKMIKLIDGEIGRILRKSNNTYKYSKNYTGRDHILSMLFLHISNCNGLRDIDCKYKKSPKVGKVFKLPTKITVVPGKISERSCIDNYVSDEKIIYLFDKGYFKYSQYDDITEKQIRFVTCQHSNAVTEEYTCTYTGIDNLYDYTVTMGNDYRKNKTRYKYREILYSALTIYILLLLIQKRFGTKLSLFNILRKIRANLYPIYT